MLVLPDKVGRGEDGATDVPVSMPMLDSSPDELEARESDAMIVFDALDSVADEPEGVFSVKDSDASMNEAEEILDTIKLAAPDEVAVRDTEAVLEPGAAFDIRLMFVVGAEIMPVLVPDAPNGAPVVPGRVFALDSPGKFDTLKLEDDEPRVTGVPDGPSEGAEKAEVSLVVGEPEARVETPGGVLEADSAAEGTLVPVLDDVPMFPEGELVRVEALVSN